MSKITNEQFIEKCIKIHGDRYDYSLTNYINNYTKVKIICKEHGIFEQRPNHHIFNRGCPKCPKKNQINTDKFIKKAKEIQGDKYDYSFVDYIDNKTKVKIVCPIHGVFEQRPKDHTNKNQGCPRCRESKGEKEILNILQNNNIIFDRQKIFKDCRYIKPLPFDFYLLEYNTCIEFDGEQHYKMTPYWGNTKDYEKIKIKDSIKTTYCKNNNIKLLRIKYNDNILDKINMLIKENHLG